MTYTKLKLKPKREISLTRRHPWVFSGGLAHIAEPLQDGEVVQITDSRGTTMATGHYSKGSIAVRVLAFDEVQIDEDFYAMRISQAYDLRKQLHLAKNPDTTGFRLVHAEGDQLPGLIIDIYGDVAVVQTHSRGMENQFEMIAGAVRKVLGDSISKVIQKSAEKNGNKTAQEDGASEVVDIKENGNGFRVNYITGQKTGFFLDQRDNRALLGQYAKGKKVLNAFSYSGGFSIFALKAGAEEVHSLDSSSKAIDLVNENIALNGLESAKHKCITMDALTYLASQEAEEAQYDIVVLDPPAFAKHRSARHKAIQAYKRLNMNALKLIKPGGILFTFSCSQVVTDDLFQNTIAAAAIESNRHIRVLHHLHQPADHPVSIFHPEGAYLKGMVLSVS